MKTGFLFLLAWLSISISFFLPNSIISYFDFQLNYVLGGIVKKDEVNSLVLSAPTPMTHNSTASHCCFGSIVWLSTANRISRNDDRNLHTHQFS